MLEFILHLYCEPHTCPTSTKKAEEKIFMHLQKSDLPLRMSSSRAWFRCQRSGLRARQHGKWLKKQTQKHPHIDGVNLVHMCKHSSIIFSDQHNHQVHQVLKLHTHKNVAYVLEVSVDTGGPPHVLTAALWLMYARLQPLSLWRHFKHLGTH